MEADKVFTTKSFEGEGRAIPLAIQTYFWRQTRYESFVINNEINLVETLLRVSYIWLRRRACFLLHVLYVLVELLSCSQILY